jgi:RHS repeat-associated protein
VESVITGMTNSSLLNAPTVNMGAVNFQPLGMSHSRYADGTATCTGELVVQIPVWSGPALAGHSLDLALLYRTHVTASAMSELGPGWHINAVDKVTATFDSGGDITALVWTSGSGDQVTYGTYESVPATFERFFKNPTNGHAFSQFRWYTHPTQGKILERYRVDGQVTRYEEVVGFGYFRPKTVFDPFDNQTTYGWDPNNRRLASITDPRGVQIRFTWNAQTCAVEVWIGITHYADLDWSYMVDTSSSRLLTLTLPKTKYVKKANGTDKLYDVSNEIEDARMISFLYTNGLLTSVLDSRYSPSATPWVCTYVNVAGRDRLQNQYDPYGRTHNFAYTAGSGSTVSEMRYTAPGGTLYTFTLDGEGRPTQVVANAASSGIDARPRLLNGDSIPEPSNLTWTLGYASCTCSLVTSLTLPKGGQYTATYDTATGKVLTFTKPSPTGTGTVTQTWSYEPFLSAARPKTYVPPSGGASLTWAYDFTNRTDGLAGQKINTSWSVTTSQITVPGQSPQVLTSSVQLDGFGRPTRTTDPEGTTVDFVYNSPTGVGQYLISKLIRAQGTGEHKETRFGLDNLGRRDWIEEGPVGAATRLDYVHDGLGRTKQVTTYPGGTAGNPVTRHYRDQWENLAVTLMKNLNEAGAAPKYDDGTGGGREWVRNEWHYFYDQLDESLLDRKPLPDAADLVNPDTPPNPWMVRYAFAYGSDGEIETVTLPNGAVTRYEIDGYGTLYRILSDAGAGSLNVESGRLYFDNDLALSQARRLLPNSTFATVTVTRNHDGQGYPFEVVDPTGVKTTVALDAMGRITQATTQGPTGPVKLKARTDYDELSRAIRLHRDLLDGSGGTTLTSTATLIFNKRSQVVEVQGDLGRKSFCTYDAAGRLKTARDNLSGSPANCNEVALDYLSGRDWVEKVTSKIFEESDDAVPPGGTRKEYVMTFDRDLLGRVTQSQYKGLDGAQTPLTRVYSYDTFGQLVLAKDPLNHFVRRTFDADGRWVEHVKRETDTAGARILLRSEYVDKHASNKNLEIKRTDGAGFLTRHEYDAAYRLLNVYRPGWTSGQAHKTSFTWDVASRVSQIVDGNGSVIDQAFDTASRLLTRTVTAGAGVSLLATKETFGYDNVGRMTSMRTDWGSNRDLLMVDEVFTPDSLGRNGSETFRYYGAGGVTTDPVVIASSYVISGAVEDPSFRRSLSYSSGHVVGTAPDAVSRLKSMTLSVPGGSQGASLASYRWGGGQVMRRSLNYVGTSNNQVTEFSFDAYRRLSTLKDTLNGGPSPYSQFDFEWDAAGNLLKEKYSKVNGQVGDRFSYDPFDRVTGAKLGVKTQADMDGAYSSAQSIKEIAYALDPGNSRDLVTETPDGGAPVTTDYTTEGGSPRYQQVGGVFPLYDGEGNCVFDGTYYLVYDFKNRLSEVYIAVEGAMGAGSESLQQATSARRPIRTRVSAEALRSSRAAIQQKLASDLGRALRNGKVHRDAGDLQAPLSGGSSSSMTLVLVALYGYDPINRRVLRSVPSVHDQRFSYDGWREVEELKPAVSGSGISAQKAFVWGVRIDELLTYQRKETDNSWTGFYATQGRHDSVVALRQADAGGTLIEKVEYDPYGKASVFVGASTMPQATSSVGNPYLYAGRRMDEETGYLYLRNRYLHTGWGRFLTNDPIGTWEDEANMGNGLTFAGNAPVVGSDPSGNLTIIGSGGSYDGIEYDAKGKKIKKGDKKGGKKKGGKKDKEGAQCDCQAQDAPGAQNPQPARPNRTFRVEFQFNQPGEGGDYDHNQGADVGHSWITITDERTGETTSFGFYSTPADGKKEGGKGANPFTGDTTNVGTWRIEPNSRRTDPSQMADVTVQFAGVGENDPRFAALLQWWQGASTNNGFRNYCLSGSDGDGNCCSNTVDAMAAFMGLPRSWISRLHDASIRAPQGPSPLPGSRAPYVSPGAVAQLLRDWAGQQGLFQTRLNANNGRIVPRIPPP